MPYRLHLVTVLGAHAVLEAPFSTVEGAMTTACAALRYGATNAWVVDEAGQKVADFAAVKKHCAASSSDSFPEEL